MKKIHVVFELNADTCAVPVDIVVEIAEVESMIKTSTDRINVIHFRGKSLPVIDPIAIITLRTHRITQKSKVLVVEKDALQYGILIEDVLGVIEMETSKIEEPTLTEPRYVTGVYQDTKIFNPHAFLNPKMIENFRLVYALQLKHLEEGIQVHGQKNQGREQIVDALRMMSLNWIVKMTKYQNVNPALLNDAAMIHNLAYRLK